MCCVLVDLEAHKFPEKRKKNAYSINGVLLHASFHPTYLLLLIKCGVFARGVALFPGDKAAEKQRRRLSSWKTIGSSR